MQVVEVLTQYSRLNRPFFYYHNGDNIEKGLRVYVTFNNRKIVGYVVGVRSTDKDIIEESLATGFSLLPIEKIMDKEPLLNEELLSLSEAVTSYYYSDQISVLNAMLPPSLKPGKSSLSAPKIKAQLFAKINPLFEDFDSLKINDQALLNKIISEGQVVVDSKNKPKILRLIEKKAVFVEKKETYRLRYKEIDSDTAKVLTEDQQEALSEILKDNHESFLLHGVTGSGKTEVYLALASEYLNQGKKILILVPEIALTGQMLSSFYARFGSKIAIIHSQLTSSEKYDEYRRIKNGEINIVVGARSAIFAPLDNIGLIIIDEEHSETYKQDNAPYYHALTVAQMRAKSFNAKIVLGSATPSIETMARAQKGAYGYFYLSKRINERRLPKTITVDMLKSENLIPANPFISKALKAAISDRLARKEQVILLVNRRGYATYVSCRHCGQAKKCPTCGIALTYHLDEHLMKCHHCGATFSYDLPCEHCGNNDFAKKGFATQKAEEEIRKLFPNHKVLRLDSDVKRKDQSPQKVIDQFYNHEADILIGTQMVAKGHDFPLVSLVGIIGTDANLAIPSFRSGERTFQLITQAIGRSGRKDIEGEAIIQTMMPYHYIVKFAQAQDYHAFYEKEMVQRYLTQNPPYYFLLSITLSHQNQDVLNETINELKYNLAGALKEDALILGPLMTRRLESGKNFSATLTLKYKNYFKIKPILLKTLSPLKEESAFYVQINVDPFDI